MTYEVLNKVSKADLISWLKHNVSLPNISDEEFLRQVKLRKLLDEQESLLKQDAELLNKIETQDDTQFWRRTNLWIESEKIREKLNANDKKINELIRMEGRK